MANRDPSIYMSTFNLQNNETDLYQCWYCMLCQQFLEKFNLVMYNTLNFHINAQISQKLPVSTHI